MNDPFDLFDRIYCINLDRRTDRWRRLTSELTRVGLIGRAERVPAAEARSGEQGCRDSHVECIRRARHAGARTVLVLEDDVAFEGDPRPTLREALNELEAAADWEALYLGGQLTARAERRGAHLFRARMLQTHAIVLHRRAFDRAMQSTAPVDAWYAEHLAAYGVSPAIAYQITDVSDISAGVQDRRGAMERSHRVYLEAPYPAYLARRGFYGVRRLIGRALVAGAKQAGIPLRFEGLRPRVGGDQGR